MSTTVPDNAWKIWFVLFGIQNVKDMLGSIVCAYWLLGQAGVLLENLGDPRLELQIVDVPHGQEDLIDGDGLFFEVHCAYIMKISLPMSRSYKGGMPCWGYLTISGCKCTLLIPSTP